jgi:ketosteroid isomerase-like protein
MRTKNYLGAQVRNMSFDPMAAAIDWLDAYRSGDLEIVLKMFAADAVVECNCCAMTTITGERPLRAYWQQRLQDCPPMNLADLQPSSDGVAVSYLTRSGVVAAVLKFNAKRQIEFLRLERPT